MALNLNAEETKVLVQHYAGKTQDVYHREEDRSLTDIEMLKNMHDAFNRAMDIINECKEFNNRE